MADIKKFVTKTSLASGGQPKRSSLMQKIHADSITIKYMSRDGLVALIQKQRQQVKSRSALNDALLQNIKQAQSMTQSLSEKTSSLPELRPPKSKRSTPSFDGSKTLIRALSPDISKPGGHGFRYRSNGDSRSSLKKFVDDKTKKLEQKQIKDFQSLKQALLKATMLHCRDSKGEYTFRPVLNDVMKRESRVMKSASDISEDLDAAKFMTKSTQNHQRFTSKTANDPMFYSTNSFRDKPLIGRRYYVKENDRFIADMMQQIYFMERDFNMQKFMENNFESEEDFEIPLRGGAEFVRSEPYFRSASQMSPLNAPEFLMPRAKSSFNIRYGVPSNVMESRKPLLDECLYKESIKASQTEIEIDDYIKDIQKCTTKKSLKKEAKRDNPFRLWQTEGGGISDTLTSIASVAAAQAGTNPSSA